MALQLRTPARLGFVEADLGLIERVFENLVGNALRHTPAGGTVELRVVEAGAELLVEVADSGRGIAPADLTFIWLQRQLLRVPPAAGLVRTLAA